MSHVPGLIYDLALILGAGAAVTLIFRFLKQPVVLGYIFAGFLVGPNFRFFPTVTDTEGITIWAEIGVIFLLFSLGLEFSFKKLASVGGAAVLTAVAEVAVMFALGYYTGTLLGWSVMNCFFLGGILSISSTTIVIKALDELGLKNTKFAQLVFGILIVEDVVAVLLLVLLSTLGEGSRIESSELLTSMLRLAFFLLLWFVSGIFLLPILLRRLRTYLDSETLLVLSIGLCLAMVLIAVKAGFSAPLGAFIMGSILGETIFGPRIEKILEPVKNLFGAVFFVSVGMLISPAMLKEYAVPIVIIAVITIAGKILSTSAGALVSGQPLRESVRTGMSLSQIGEFSFIIATLGLSLKVTDDFLYPVAVAVSAITTFTTPYLVKSSDSVSRHLENILPASWRQWLENYSRDKMKVRSESLWKEIVRKYLVVVSLNSVIIISIMFAASAFSKTYSGIITGGEFLGTLIICIAALLLMGPFLWGLALKKIRLDSLKGFSSERKYYRAPVIVLELLRAGLAVLFIAIFLDELFPASIAIAAALAVAFASIVFTSKRLNKVYGRIEKTFIDNLNAKEITSGEHQLSREEKPDNV